MTANTIVSSNNLICLVGGAKIENLSLSADFPFVDSFVGVDGGADHLLDAGLAPAAVIGDLDSLSDLARATFAAVLCHISEQETTDFEKALIRVAAPAVLALGFTGGRIDHGLAVLNVMARYPERAILLVDQDDVSFIAKRDGTDLTLPAGCRISLMPLADVRVTASGLRWPFADMCLAPAGKTSSSNAAAGGPIHIETDGPLLITLPQAYLQTALKAAARVE